MDWAEFAALRVDLLAELIIGAALGGLIGLEREWSGKPAGLRTNILICVGAALITDLSIEMAGGAGSASRADVSRLAAQIVSGVGFLGAGTIIQSRGAVIGLTSAATLWVVAAIGIAVGSGHITEAVGTGFLVLLVLLPLGALERGLAVNRQVRTLVVELPRSSRRGNIINVAEQCGLSLRSEEVHFDVAALKVRLEMVGSATAWSDCCDMLRARSDVRAVHFS